MPRREDEMTAHRATHGLRLDPRALAHLRHGARLPATPELQPRHMLGSFVAARRDNRF
jgi:hypothetical protein